MCSRGRVIQRCHNKNPREGMWPGMWSMGWDLRKVCSLRLRPGRGESNLCATGAARVGGGADGKVSIDRWYLSPYVEKSLNPKLIKSFVPELRSRKCFLCFGIPMLSMCVMDIMSVLRTGTNISISRIHIRLCYKWLICHKTKPNNSIQLSKW